MELQEKKHQMLPTFNFGDTLINQSNYGVTKLYSKKLTTFIKILLKKGMFLNQKNKDTVVQLIILEIKGCWMELLCVNNTRLGNVNIQAIESRGSGGTSYMNVLTGSPDKLRVAGQSPSIQRNFSVTPNDNYELTYTQSENNSVSLDIEQSPNGTNSWSTLMNTTSTNGTHTRSFTPTASYVRVRYSSTACCIIYSKIICSRNSSK